MGAFLWFLREQILFLADVVFVINGCLDIFYNWIVSN